MKVTKYRSVAGNGSLIGFFSLIYKDTYGGRFINDLKLFMKDGKKFIGNPDRKYENDHGEVKYAPYTGYVDREANDKFTQDVIKAIDLYCIEESQKVKNVPTPTVNHTHDGNIVDFESQNIEPCPF